MRYRFGDCAIDATAYTLKRGEQDVPLQRKVFDLLCLLIENRGRLVTKAEFLDVLWPADHVNEGAVPWTIFHARRALGQGRNERGPIETVPGRGYRWIAPVELEPSASPLPATPAPKLPFVGRAEVMQRLEARLAQARAGEGGLCLLVGEAGIGKTRCVEELRARAEPMWTGRSVDGLGAPVFWPWIQVLREALRDRPSLRESGDALLARMVAFETDESAGEGRGRGGAGDHFWAFDGVSRLLLEAAAQSPVCVLLEDLHWADAATMELLEFLVPLMSRAPMLVVGTLREPAPEREERPANALRRGAVRIDLGHLSGEDVARYIAELSGKRPPAALSQAVHRATAGNPLFLQETVRSLIAEHGADKLAELAPSAVAPSRIARDVLRSRLAEVEASARSALSVASVLGQTFEVALLQRVSGWSLEPLLDALETARHAGLISTDRPHRYRFAHDLLRSILYDDLSSAERVAVHRRAAELLAELVQGARRESEVAHHFYRSLPAGDYARVSAAALRAAETADRVYAFEDAAKYYRWALEAQELEPGTPPRERAELLFAAGRAERRAGRTRAARRTLSQLIQIATEHGYADLLLRAARVLRPSPLDLVPDPLVRSALEEVLRIAPAGPNAQRISALSQLAWIPPYAHDIKRSGELSDDALELARALGDPTRLGEALRARLHALSGPDHIDAVLEVSDELLALPSPGPWARREAYAARIGAFLHRGDVSAADAVLRQLESAAHETRLPEAIWLHDRLSNQRRLLDGDFAAARAACTELGARAERMGLGYGAFCSRAQLHAIALYEQGPEVGRGWNMPVLFALCTHPHASYRAGLVSLSAELGLVHDARGMLDVMSAGDFEDVPRDIGYLNALAHLGRAAALLGDAARGRRLYALLLPYRHYNTPNGMLLYEGSVSHTLALLAQALGDPDLADEHFADALELNARIGARPQLARVLCDHASALASRGRSSRARAAASRAHELASALGMDWLASRARALVP